MWGEICHESHNITGIENDSRWELVAHLRYILAKRNELQVANWKYLLIDDVKEYVRTTAITQMNAWISLHKNMIKESIKRAEKDMSKISRLMSLGSTKESIERSRYKKRGIIRKHMR